jgi:hypothetical protein
LRRVAASAALLCAVFAAPSASASPESDAKDLFARGRELRAANDCANAAPLFRKAWTIFPQGLGSLRNLAECEEQLGHFTSSRRSWLDLKRALVTMANDPKYEGWDKDAEDAATRLKGKIGIVVIDVYVNDVLANDKTGVELVLNGESMGAALVGTPLERDPGQYRVRAQLAGAEPVEQVVNIGSGENPRVTIRLTRATKQDNVVRVQPATDGSGRRTIGWIVGGVGVASLIGAGVTFLLRQGALDDLEKECPNYENGQPCPFSSQAKVKDITDRGELMGILSPTLLGVGVVGVGAGLALILTAPKSEPAAASKNFQLNAGLGRIDATWRF